VVDRQIQVGNRPVSLLWTVFLAGFIYRAVCGFVGGMLSAKFGIFSISAESDTDT
jgi:hypothetical protein